ncbi:unnamed protein product [Zymoseptoria tritici ST99CH_1A5]|uniref:Uncharacterized protein n=1 Tax=Zymoseptoria tritici ST99CH_1A5 TaxID=1276529 RepID=A0A1Y6LS95_ZYMTR|nr:unnamed protein product [Zymoseptoria tritici ST99CH_3D1]SMY27273.1 unnamed protein product [Zymoseptoria tritici ST99CH_1A5]
MSYHFPRIPGNGARPPNWDFPSAVDFTERHFHEGLRGQYGPGYRHDPAAQFQYYGGWDGYAGRAVTDDWRQQFMDMQREGRYQMPYYGGFW